jgi:hypothetical protein
MQSIRHSVFKLGFLGFKPDNENNTNFHWLKSQKPHLNTFNIWPGSNIRWVTSQILVPRVEPINIHGIGPKSKPLGLTHENSTWKITLARKVIYMVKFWAAQRTCMDQILDYVWLRALKFSNAITLVIISIFFSFTSVTPHLVLNH